jgi:midasin (ATPase involved in ribosome maturation)
LLTSGGTNNTKIRDFIVECFIKLTKHFTEGAFTDLLKNQQEVHDILFNQYDENADINKAINNLSNTTHKVVSFDEINPFLLFFHEGNGQLFSIITNKNTSQEESKNLLQLINSQVIRKEERISQLPDYKNYNQEQFLEELKKILDINTPMEKLKEISGNYVFTADNFIKMVLILLRIRSNIPVIMMGETGCGKTSLIRKLSELKNDGKKNKMKILNIHAGTNDNDIINFIKNEIYPESIKLIMEENIEKKNYEDIGLIFEESKFWVFLDEINTCKSMGLISELLCKHSYLGYPLPSNVVFIAACNPYRQISKKVIETKIGLDINQAKKEQKLLLLIIQNTQLIF